MVQNNKLHMREIEEKLRRFPTHKSLSHRAQEDIMETLSNHVEKPRSVRNLFKPVLAVTSAMMTICLLIGACFYIYTGQDGKQLMSKSQSATENSGSSTTSSGEDRAQLFRAEEAPASNVPSAAPAKAAQISFLKTVEMVNRDKGWLLTSNKLYTTRDGGNNWVPAMPAKAAKKRIFADFQGEFGWLVAPGKPTIVYRSTDLGKTWRKTVINSNKNSDKGNFVSGNVSFTSQQLGSLLLNRITTSNKYTTKAYQTNDGGETWNSVYRKQGSIKSINGVAFIDKKSGWLTGRSRAKQMYLFETHNNGKEWSRAKTNSIKGIVITKEPITFNERTVYVPMVIRQADQTSVLQFLKSSSSGESWTKTKPVPIRNFAVAWDFLSPEIGYVATSDSLYKTQNGGANWLQTNMPSDIGAIKDISFLSESHGTLLTERQVLTTTDAGDNWRTVATLREINSR